MGKHRFVLTVESSRIDAESIQIAIAKALDSVLGVSFKIVKEQDPETPGHVLIEKTVSAGRNEWVKGDE